MKEKFAHDIAEIAQKSILYEASTWPKPGLVDPVDQGAHKDMDFFTFIASGSALYRGLYRCAEEAFHIEELSEIMGVLRPIGICCEEDMFNATNGVNTHKGIIFSMGLLCASAAVINKRGVELSSENLCKCVKEITKGLSESDFQGIKSKEKLTKGEYFFLNHGIKGIRGEAENGFPTVMEKGLPIIKKWSKEENESRQSKNSLFLDVLFSIMSELDDTNILSRGGFENLKYVKRVSEEFMKNGGMRQDGSQEILMHMSNEFKRRNISPGGAADLLAVTIFLAEIDGIKL